MSFPWWEVSNADDLPSPTVLIYPDRISQNLDRMIAWSGDPARLRPHVKTHKLAQIIRLKLEKGIRKFKAATIAEVEMVAAAGGPDILLAMQPVGANFARVIKAIQRFPDATISVLVDDANHLDWMERQAKRAGVRVSMFVDLNVGMNRTGIAVGSPALALCRKLIEMSQQTSSAVRFAGLHAYDGHLVEPSDQRLTQKAHEAFAPVWQLVETLTPVNAGVAPTIVVSGTPTSPILANLGKSKVELSAGTTVLWDWGQQRTCPNHSFVHAAVLLARVVSKPAGDRLCLDLGHKAVASEFPPPRVHLLGLEDAVPAMHGEEHLVLETPRAAEYSVGQVVYGIPYHVCPTIALHSHVWCVRDAKAIECWRVEARDRVITI